MKNIERSPKSLGSIVCAREVSVKGVALYVQHYSGPNADREEIIIPFGPLLHMREQYGFSIEDSYDIRFTVFAGVNTGANIAFDDATLIEIEYQPEEPEL